MTKHEIPGASYVDAGRDWYVALIERRHFATHLGPIPLPPDEPRGLWFVRGSTVGGFHFAGKGADSSLSWEWREGQWGRFSSATGSGCYDQRGNFRDTVPAGYQYCADDGSLVSRIETYPVRDGVNNWTERDGIRIGQGNPGGGIRVFADGVLRELEPGSCWFPNVNREGEHVTVSFWKPQEHCAVIIQTTLGELRALPPVTLPGTPIPVPVPPPVPPKEPPVSLPDPSAVLAAIARELAKLPTDRKLTNDEMGLAINNAALGFEHVGLHRKAPGAESNAILPDGAIVNRNVLRFHPPDDPDFGWWSDVLIGAGTGFPKATAPHWQRGRDDRRSWVAPKRFGVVTLPPPTTPPSDDVLRAIVRAAVSDLRNVAALLDRAVNE
jgi:hypothetical protein